MTRTTEQIGDAYTAAAITRACLAAGAPELIVGYLDSGRSLEAVVADLSRFAGIAEAVALAGRVNMAVDPSRLARELHARGLSVAEARAELDRLPMLRRAAPPASWAPFARRDAANGVREGTDDADQ